MININYTLRGEIVDLRSDLVKPFREVDADIYIDKQKGWLDFSVGFNQSINSFKSEIYDLKRTRNNTKIKTNTTAISITDIIVNSKPYYYKLVFNNINGIDPDALKAFLDLEDLVFFEGSYYTNTLTYYHSNSEWIYTEKVIPKDHEVIYKSKYIEIITSPNCHFKLDEYVISPQVVNPYTAYIPSFYLETLDGKIYRCIDSNVKYFTSSSNTKAGNFLRYKLSNSTKTSSKDFNMFLGTDENELLEFRLSSNCLPLKSMVEYFKVLPNGSIVSSDKNDFTFKLNKVIDNTKIVVTPNNYKIDKGNKFSSNILGGIVNTFEEDNEKLNDFDVIYHPIENTLPRYFYINYDDTFIMCSEGSSEFLGAFEERSLYDDSLKVEPINPAFSNTMKEYTRLDNKNYEVLNDN